MHLGSPQNLGQLNADAPWDAFDPQAYFSHNYQTMMPVDAEIIALVRTHFSDHFRRSPDRPARAIDVGSGANLYPALAMLPWCEEITLLERAQQNVEYLRKQWESYDPSWDDFWRLLCQDEAYAELSDDPRSRFGKVAAIEPGNLFDLVGRQGQWSLGTMFFVAESLSTSHGEFQQALKCFMHCLTPGAPFAAAFMEHSQGYEVGGTHFPACDVSESEIRTSLDNYADELRTYRVGRPNELRQGYTSMIVACGFRGTGTS
ncbi:methyltransferase [Streptomyces sp. HUCO-GS316]|uniref:SCO2525 family SAM-dependent methyltransferase n=1 Tax=Streptomyces sp. HUCO-GS316 TaxID=2692198 RepID=UPI00136F6B0F|nr:SCO2525 family SAM-dependent methyltransferase [Streptomyces sp. HUCO-GS316]MXM62044.1 methyltransferase [Streptomyces sp. HUCO-GS316]